MAMYSRGVLVFGVGMLLVINLWCMKGTEAGGAEPPAAGGGGGCNSKNSDAGEECTDEDDALGLYADVDDSFRSAVKKVAGKVHHFHEHLFGGGDNNDDSPNVAHNNVDVLGH